MSVIKLENISKQYRLGNIGTGTLSHDLNRWWHRMRGKEDPYLRIGEVNNPERNRSNEYVWALKNISFEVQQGEVLGIIGRNGAGKSTLLKILSRTTAPTSGRMRIKGRVASLLEVGTGFHPELTGRENVYLNGAILGMTKKEIFRKFDEIVAFAGVERYIDTPVKRYSSGMYVRLAFGVAAHLEPEVLIIDEVLAVGDAEFQKKCLGKMKDISVKEGRTVLFVSHNMSAVRTLCNNGLVLEEGKIVLKEEINTAIKRYQSNISNINKWQGEDGDTSLKILETKVFCTNNSNEFKTSSELTVSLCINLFENYNELVIAFTIKSIYGHPIATALYNDYNDYSTLSKGLYEIQFTIPPYFLASGEYEIIFNISIPYVKQINTERINLAFKIIADNDFGNRFYIENNQNFNSIIRPNWFNSIKKLTRS